MKYIYLVIVIVLINSCGSSDDGFYGNVTIDNSYYICTSESAYKNCLNNKNCSKCKPSPKCKVEENHVTGINGKTCRYDIHNLECKYGTATVDTVWTDKEVLLNNIIYTCSEY